jgi:hypothetical protein
VGDDLRERRLSNSGRAPHNQTPQAIFNQGLVEPLARSKEMGLTYNFVQVKGSHPIRQGGRLFGTKAAFSTRLFKQAFCMIVGSRCHKKPM